MGIKKLIRNIRFLLKHDLSDWDYYANNLNYFWRKEASAIAESLKYEWEEDLKELYRPDIKDFEETIDEILNTDKSFARFGDGEFQIMNNQRCIFEVPDKKLSKKLKTVIKAENPDVMVGIPYMYYHSVKNKSELDKPFHRLLGGTFRKTIESFIDKNKTYYASDICPYIVSNLDNLDSYYEKIKDIWRNKDITIVCGDKVFNHIETNIFDCANSIEYLYTPTVNASEKYDEIFERIKEVKNKLIILICGPVATALAYDVACYTGGGAKLRALDLGHIAKDYDYYVNKRSRDNIKSTRKFFGAED